MATLFHHLSQGKALLLIIILGFGGSFQSGYHTTNLSSPSPFIQDFINSSWYDRYDKAPPPQTVTMIWSLIVSMYAVGGLFGAVSVKFFSRWFGRKKAIICNSFISIIAAGIMFTSKRAKSFEMIIVSRILYGYASGLGGSLHLMFLGEISPRKIRGSVTLTFATFISLGKLSGQVLGLSELLGRQDLWNVVLSVPVLFSVVQLVSLPFLPDAPRYLFIEKGDEKACERALQSLWGKGDYLQEMDEMLAEQVALQVVPRKSPLQLLKARRVRWQLITMFTIYSCNSLSGPLVIGNFSYDIFLKTGIPQDKIRYITLGLGVSEILTSVFCGLLIEHAGRRLLFWGGYSVMAACWMLVTVTLNLNDLGDWLLYVTAALIILFIVFFRGGPGAATLALNSELFVQSDRAAAFVLVGLQRWSMMAVMGFIFPFIITALGSFCFMLFGCVCLVGSIYTFFFLPETKGKTLLEISEVFKTMTVFGKSFSEEKSFETKF